MAEWEDVLAVAAEWWGADNVRQARHDVVEDAAPLPALMIVEDAAWYIAQRGGIWDEPTVEDFVALRACYLARRDEFIQQRPHQPSELGECFMADTRDAAWTLVPEASCVCGTAYKVQRRAWSNPPEYEFWHIRSRRRVAKDADCACGRAMKDIDTGEPGQLALGLAFA